MNFPNPFSEPLLFLVRHCAIEAPLEKCFVGQTDLPLGENGRNQATRLEKSLASIAFSQAFCSDLKRAAQTAAILCRNRAIPVKPEPALREIHLGDWDGQPMGLIRERFPDLWRARGIDMGGFRPPGGESFADLRNRSVSFIRQIADGMAGNILVVTHAGVIRVLLCRVLQMPLPHLFRFHLDYGGITLIRDINGMPRVKAVNLLPAGNGCLPSTTGAAPIEA